MYADSQFFSKVDSLTGLQTKSAYLTYAAQHICAEYFKSIETGTVYDLKKHWVYALDMNNFKVGNSSLGHAKFDSDVVLPLAEGFIGLSRALGSTKSPYGNEDVKDEDIKKRFQEYFPEKSTDPKDQEAKLLLDAAQAQGIHINFMRYNAGGDEGILDIFYEQGHTEKRQAIAEKLINHVFRKTILPRVNPQYYESLRSAGQTIEGELKINANDKTSPQKAAHLNAFVHELTGYLQDSGKINEVVDDDTILIRMGATMKGGSYEDAFKCFFYGVDLKAQQRTYDDGSPRGLLKVVEETDSVEINTQNLEKFREEVRSRFELITHVRGRAEAEFVKKYYDEVIGKRITGEFLELLMDHVDTVGKKEEKKQLVIDALCENPEQLLQFLALKRDGRMGKGEFENEDLVYILESVMNHYRSDKYKEQYDAIKAAPEKTPSMASLMRLYEVADPQGINYTPISRKKLPLGRRTHHGVKKA